MGKTKHKRKNKKGKTRFRKTNRNSIHTKQLTRRFRKRGGNIYSWGTPQTRACGDAIDGVVLQGQRNIKMSGRDRCGKVPFQNCAWGPPHNWMRPWDRADRCRQIQNVRRAGVESFKPTRGRRGADLPRAMASGTSMGKRELRM